MKISALDKRGIEVNREYQICTKCIMDTTDPDISFDEKGACNHCKRYEEIVPSRVFEGEEAKTKMEAIVSKMKKDGKGRDYDCIIGVSGGVDSTYIAYLVKELGLRPLAIHFDNGWNSELAVSNIEKVLSKLGIDLYTYVINWEEFRDLQISFLKASTPDGEVPTDHAIGALLWREASNRGIKYIISGMNFKSEAMSVPAWAYGHSDWKYIKSVHKLFGTKKLKTYPHFSFIKLFTTNFVRGIRTVSLLNYMDYNKEEAMDVLQNQLDWVYYGGKHYESIYTRFYQSYILPRKFNIDKRRGHLSDLINSGQLTREAALVEIEKEICPKELLEEDKEYVIKKFGLTEKTFDDLMNLPLKNFRHYKNSYEFVQFLRNLVNRLRSKGLYAK